MFLFPLSNWGQKWEGGFERERDFSQFNKLEEIQTPALSHPTLFLLRFLREVLEFIRDVSHIY